MSSATNKRYPPELRERAVRMVAEIQHEYPSEWAAVESVADKLGHRYRLRIYDRCGDIEYDGHPSATLSRATSFRCGLQRKPDRHKRSKPLRPISHSLYRYNESRPHPI